MKYVFGAVSAAALDGLLRGEILSSRRMLGGVLGTPDPADPGSILVAENLWRLDLLLRQRLWREVLAQRARGELGHALGTVGLLGRVLALREEDIARYLQRLGYRDASVTGADPLMDPGREEASLRRAIRALIINDDPVAAADELRIAIRGVRTHRRGVESIIASGDVPTQEEIRMALERGSRVAYEVWSDVTPVSASADAGLLPHTIESVSRRVAEAPLSEVLAPKEMELLMRADPDAGLHAFFHPNWGIGEMAVRESELEPPAKPAASERGSLRRVPHMNLSPHGELEPGSSVEVSIWADRDEARDGERSTAIDPDAPADLQSLEVEVEFSFSAHFTSRSPRVGRITINRAEDRTNMIVFRLSVRAAEELLALEEADRREAWIVARFRYEGRPAGKVERMPEIALPPEPMAAATPDVLHRADPPPHDGDSQPVILVETQTRQPDLLVEVKRIRRSDSRNFLCRVSSPLLTRNEWRLFVDSQTWKSDLRDAAGVSSADSSGDVYLPWSLSADSDKFVRDRMGEFVAPDLSPLELVTRLRGAGAEFFDAAPDNFRDFYWHLVDNGKKLRTISIVSEEPFIPWELMVPHRGNETPGTAIGAEYLLGRWTDPNWTSGKQHLRLSDSLLVAPRYDGENALEHAQQEVAMVTGQFPGPDVQPAVLETLEAAFQNSTATLLHFACHGAESSTNQVILLEQRKKWISTQVRVMSGMRSFLGKRRTLVFLNACQVGRTTASLVGVGGFAAEFIRAGAIAVIAPLWSVVDSVAYDVARRFYEALELDRSRPLADIMREIRACAYDSDKPEDTYAAYCFYGDPLARLSS
jgi:hypothetical protein